MSNWHSHPLRVVALMAETTPEERLTLITPFLQKEDAVWALIRQNQLMHEETQMLSQQLQTLQNENRLLRQQIQVPKKQLLGKRVRSALPSDDAKTKPKDTVHKKACITPTESETNTYAQTLLSLAVPMQTANGDK